MEELSPMPARKGRGASFNPPTRFDPFYVIEDPASLDEDSLRQVPTEYFTDSSRTILARNESPDVPFTYSLNPYRGCEHGCIYCYARPSHEYLGFSSGLDFETRILIKPDAPELLSRTFQSASWKPEPVSLSGNTDPYQPIERRLELTRRCLQIFLKHRNPLYLITKNRLILRDLDVLQELSAHDLVHVSLSITSLKPEITNIMEPRTARPSLRLKVIEQLAAAGISVGVNVAPIIPGLTDEEIPSILKHAVENGATVANYQMLRLPGQVKVLFTEWLERSFPERAEKVLSRIRDIHGSTLSSNEFGLRMTGSGEWAETIEGLFKMTCRRLGLKSDRPDLSTHQFRHLRDDQLELF